MTPITASPGFDPSTKSRIRAKRYLRLINSHIAIIDELIHLVADESDNIPEDAQLEIADAVRHFRAMKDSITSAISRIHTA